MTITLPSLPNSAALRRADEIVTGYAIGRIKSTALYFAFFERHCLSLPPHLEDVVEDAAEAYRQWSKATPTDGHWMTPDERRALLDRALLNLVAVLDTGMAAAA